MGEGTTARVEVTPDIVELMLSLHEPQARPISLRPLTGLPGGHVLLACNAVEVPSHQKATCCWQAGQQLLCVILLSLRCGRRRVHGSYRVGLATKGEVH